MKLLIIHQKKKTIDIVSNVIKEINFLVLEECKELVGYNDYAVDVCCDFTVDNISLVKEDPFYVTLCLNRPDSFDGPCSFRLTVLGKKNSLTDTNLQSLSIKSGVDYNIICETNKGYDFAGNYGTLLTLEIPLSTVINNPGFYFFRYDAMDD